MSQALFVYFMYIILPSSFPQNNFEIGTILLILHIEKWKIKNRVMRVQTQDSRFAQIPFFNITRSLGQIKMNCSLASHICLQLSKHNVVLTHLAHKKASVTESMVSTIRNILTRSRSYVRVGITIHRW